jgi:hypothetical protein
MAPATTRSELRRFVRDLRWIVPLWLAAAMIPVSASLRP